MKANTVPSLLPPGRMRRQAATPNREAAQVQIDMYSKIIEMEQKEVISKEQATTIRDTLASMSDPSDRNFVFFRDLNQYKEEYETMINEHLRGLSFQP